MCVWNHWNSWRSFVVALQGVVFRVSRKCWRGRCSSEKLCKIEAVGLYIKFVLSECDDGAFGGTTVCDQVMCATLGRMQQKPRSQVLT